MIFAGSFPNIAATVLQFWCRFISTDTGGQYDHIQEADIRIASNPTGSRESNFKKAGKATLLTAVMSWACSSCRGKEWPQLSNWTLTVDRLKSISYICRQDLFKKFCMCQCKNNRSQKGSETVNIRVIRAKQLATESHQESSYSCAQYNFSSRS